MTTEAEKLHDLLENQESLVQFGLSLKVWEPGFWWERCFLCLLIQMPVSAGNTLTDIPRNNVLPAMWVSLSQCKLTYKINCYKVLFLLKLLVFCFPDWILTDAACNYFALILRYRKPHLSATITFHCFSLDQNFLKELSLLPFSKSSILS